MNKTSLFQDQLIHASRSLGLEIIVPFGMQLAGGVTLVAQALLPELGGKKGMLVFRTRPNGAALKELTEKGFGFSVFEAEPPSVSRDLSHYKELFSQWGWAGSDLKKPNWLIEPKKTTV